MYIGDNKWGCLVTKYRVRREERKTLLSIEYCETLMLNGQAEKNFHRRQKMHNQRVERKIKYRQCHRSQEKRLLSET